VGNSSRHGDPELHGVSKLWEGDDDFRVVIEKALTVEPSHEIPNVQSYDRLKDSFLYRQGRAYSHSGW
jgi:hypothetical protein